MIHKLIPVYTFIPGGRYTSIVIVGTFMVGLLHMIFILFSVFFIYSENSIINCKRENTI